MLRNYVITVLTVLTQLGLKLFTRSVELFVVSEQVMADTIALLDPTSQRVAGIVIDMSSLYCLETERGQYGTWGLSANSIISD